MATAVVECVDPLPVDIDYVARGKSDSGCCGGDLSARGKSVMLQLERRPGVAALCPWLRNMPVQHGLGAQRRTKADEVGGSCSTGIECAKVQLSTTARKGATQ